MSSLMQHTGIIDKRGVELKMYLVREEIYHYCDQCGTRQDANNLECAGCKKPFSQRFVGRGDKWEMQILIPYENRAPGSASSEASLCERSETIDCEPVELIRPNGNKSICPKLYRIFRKPVGMFGCWVVFRWNGEKHVPDLSVPISVNKLPRDAKEIPESEAREYWFN